MARVIAKRDRRGAGRGARSRRKPRILVWAEYAVFRVVAAAFRHASRGALERWSRRTARAAQRLLRGRTRLALRNLSRVYPEMPEEEKRALVAACWRHYAASIFEFLHTIDAPIDAIADRFEIGPEFEAIARAPKEGGAIIVTAHFGSWESAVSLVTRIDSDFSVVARRLDNPILDERINRARLRSGMRLLDRRRAARGLFQTLERSGIVAMVADQAVRPKEGVLVPFLGVPAWTTHAPARLALRFGVPIFCLFAVPVGDRFRLIIEPPIRAADLPPEQRTVEAITARINEVLSDRIRTAPELWLWMHNRWKGADAPAAETASD